jgi:hypothetical protein
MRRIIHLTLFLSLVTVGPAMADRHNNRPAKYNKGGNGHRHYSHHNAPRHHSHVRHTSGYYSFRGGHRVRHYGVPNHPRYIHRHQRPVLLVERYDPVPGYIWVGGSWGWGGAQWVWTPGYYAVAY